MSASWTVVAVALLVVCYATTKYIDWKARAIVSARPTRFLRSAGASIAVLIVFAMLVSAVAVSYRGTPLLVAILGGVLVVVSVLMSRTVFGRRLYAIGGNPSAARYAGINAKWYCFLVFLFAGALYGLAGLMLDGHVETRRVGEVLRRDIYTNYR
jgi:putative multiple sugar transport system permease protein